MRNPTYFLVIGFILIITSGCQTDMHAKEKDYYEQFSNPHLKYEWDFNSSMKDSGGHTYNSTYFQLRKHNKFDEVIRLRIPYPFQYKHEEGHIYQYLVLNITDMEQFYDSCKVSRPQANFTTFRNYFLTVTEGAAEYYAITYFNNPIGKKHVSYLLQKGAYDELTQRYYLGFMYVNKTISEGLYSNLQQFIVDICSEDQYKNHQKFVNTQSETY